MTVKNPLARLRIASGTPTPPTDNLDLPEMACVLKQQPFSFCDIYKVVINHDVRIFERPSGSYVHRLIYHKGIYLLRTVEKAKSLSAAYDASKCAL